MRILFIQFICLITFCYKVKGQDDVKSTPQTRKVFHLISSLPEVVLERDFLKKSHIKLVIQIAQITTKDDNNYLVEVDEDQGWRLASLYFFYVNSSTYAIKYWAVAENKDIPLSVWRKRHYKDY